MRFALKLGRGAIAVGLATATSLKNSLVALGVPADRNCLDYAGFRTLDSVVRPHEVLGQSQITVISQKFHIQRAIFIARHRRVDAIGFNAPEVGCRVHSPC